MVSGLDLQLFNTMDFCGDNTQHFTDISTYRKNRPRGRFVENIDALIAIWNPNIYLFNLKKKVL